MRKLFLKTLSIYILIAASASATAGQTGWIITAKVKTIVATGNCHSGQSPLSNF